MIFIGICGPSNSGKSSLCRPLAEKYNTDYIEVDHYLKDVEEIPFIGSYKNWELPQDYRFDDLLKDLNKLISSKSINHPIYDFKKGKIKGYREIKPNKIIFIEGFYLFFDKGVRDLVNIKICLDIPMEELLKRRVCTEEEWDWSKRDYVEKVCILMFQKYGVSQKKYADFVLDATTPLQEIEKQVRDIIKSKI